MLALTAVQYAKPVAAAMKVAAGKIKVWTVPVDRKDQLIERTQAPSHGHRDRLLDTFFIFLCFCLHACAQQLVVRFTAYVPVMLSDSDLTLDSCSLFEQTAYTAVAMTMAFICRKSRNRHIWRTMITTAAVMSGCCFLSTPVIVSSHLFLAVKTMSGAASAVIEVTCLAWLMKAWESNSRQSHAVMQLLFFSVRLAIFLVTKTLASEKDSYSSQMISLVNGASRSYTISGIAMFSAAIFMMVLVTQDLSHSRDWLRPQLSLTLDPSKLTTECCASLFTLTKEMSLCSVICVNAMQSNDKQYVALKTRMSELVTMMIAPQAPSWFVYVAAAVMLLSLAVCSKTSSRQVALSSSVLMVIGSTWLMAAHSRSTSAAADSTSASTLASVHMWAGMLICLASQAVLMPALLPLLQQQVTSVFAASALLMASHMLSTMIVSSWPTKMTDELLTSNFTCSALLLLLLMAFQGLTYHPGNNSRTTSIA